MDLIFIQIAVILFIAFVISSIIKALKQPLIIGYIITGIVISPFIIYFGTSKELISIFSDFGIVLLLFIVGLHLNPKIIKEIGGTSLIIGIVQIILSFFIGFIISFALGLNNISSFYIGLALSFSSTIIVMKLLSDNRQLDSLYGKISTGILIIQDLVAIIVLIILSSIANNSSFSSFKFNGIVGAFILSLFLFFIGFFVISRMMKQIAKSQELLFLFSICWCFIIAAAFSYLGFSIEIGALLAGVVLSVSPYSTEISAKIRPLRDFFLIIFFIILGLEVQINNINSVIINSVIISFIVLISRPLILMTLMAFFGYTKRNNFLVGITLSQISEFSMIIILLGFSLGHISNQIVQTISITLIITVIFSTYLMSYSGKIYEKSKKLISIFEIGDIRKNNKIKKSYDAILFGYNRIGFSILNSFKKLNKNYLVVDFNPDTIENLNKFKIPCVYGDIGDSDFIKEFPLEKVELVVSTIPDFESNIVLIKTLKKINPKAIIIVRAHQINDALELYEAGANYVLTPHFLGGDYLAKLILDERVNEKGYNEEKEKHIKNLLERIKRGQEHPDVEKD